MVYNANTLQRIELKQLRMKTESQKDIILSKKPKDLLWILTQKIVRKILAKWNNKKGKKNKIS